MLSELLYELESIGDNCEFGLISATTASSRSVCCAGQA
jgi:hypothetical protein